MYPFDGEGIRFPLFLSGVHPFDGVFVCLTVTLDDSFHDVLSVFEGDIVYNIMYVGITFMDAGQLLAVQEDFRLADIGIDSDGSDFLFAIHIPALCQVEDRVFAPVRLVPEIRVFLRLAVERHQPLHVTGGKVAAVGQRSGKIESVP